MSTEANDSHMQLAAVVYTIVFIPSKFWRNGNKLCNKKEPSCSHCARNFYMIHERRLLLFVGAKVLKNEFWNIHEYNSYFFSQCSPSSSSKFNTACLTSTRIIMNSWRRTRQSRVHNASSCIIIPARIHFNTLVLLNQAAPQTWGISDTLLALSLSH